MRGDGRGAGKEAGEEGVEGKLQVRLAKLLFDEEGFFTKAGSLLFSVETMAFQHSSPPQSRRQHRFWREILQGRRVSWAC